MRIGLSRTDQRLGVLALGVFGLLHLVAPHTLLRTARTAYGLALDVEFRPGPNAARRVRAIGLAATIGAVLGWHRLDDGSVRTRAEDGFGRKARLDGVPADRASDDQRPRPTESRVASPPVPAPSHEDSHCSHS